MKNLADMIKLGLINSMYTGYSLCKVPSQIRTSAANVLQPQTCPELQDKARRPANPPVNLGDISRGQIQDEVSNVDLVGKFVAKVIKPGVHLIRHAIVEAVTLGQQQQLVQLLEQPRAGLVDGWNLWTQDLSALRHSGKG